MFRKIVLLTALIGSGAVFAQQNADISGAQFHSGAGDATLSALGQKAAASGKRLVITAPPEWHAAIAAKVRAGGNANVVLREGFYENVLVRVEDAGPREPTPAEKAKAEAAKAEAEKARIEKAKADEARVAAKAKADAAEAARRQAERAREEAARRQQAEADAARADAERQRLAAEQAKTAEAPKPAAPAAAPAKKAEAAPTAETAPAGPADEEAARNALRMRLVAGRAPVGTLGAGDLVAGDLVHVEGAAKAVIRRAGRRKELFWLVGAVNLDQPGLKAQGDGVYQVIDGVR